MTRDYGKVRAQFWDDDALRELSLEANYLALYLITSSHTNAIGCFRLPAAYVVDDTRLDKKAFERALGELLRAGYAVPCERVPWIYIPNFLRHNPPENPNVWRKCVKELESVPAGISAAARIAEELVAIAAEERMSREANRTRVSTDEITRLERFRDCIETVSEGSTPLSSSLPIPFPNQTIPCADAKVLVVDPEFEDFWKRYRPPPNANKPDTRKAWGQTASTRPPQSELLRSVDGYNAWLAEETRKRRSEYPKQHPATWLRGEVWGGFLTEAQSDMDPEELAALRDRVDRKLKRGAYAETFQ